MIDSLFTALGLDQSERQKGVPSGSMQHSAGGAMAAPLPPRGDNDASEHLPPQLKIITHIPHPSDKPCATPQIPPLSLRSLDSVEQLGSLPPTPLTLEIMKQQDRKPTFVLHVPSEAPVAPMTPLRRGPATPGAPVAATSSAAVIPEPHSPSLFDLAAICDAKRRLPSSGRVKSHAPFVKKTCGFCHEEITVKDTTLKCRKCKHCIHCLKDLKTGGGRHRLCPLCNSRCYDQRNGREACQQCRPTRSANAGNTSAKRVREEMKQHINISTPTSNLASTSVAEAAASVALLIPSCSAKNGSEKNRPHSNGGASDVILPSTPEQSTNKRSKTENDLSSSPSVPGK